MGCWSSTRRKGTAGQVFRRDGALHELLDSPSNSLLRTHASERAHQDAAQPETHRSRACIRNRILRRDTQGEVLAQLVDLAAPQLGFNYLGRFAAPASAGWGAAGAAVRLGAGDPAMPLAHALEVNALTLDDAEGPKLTANWTWAPALLTEAEVGDLAQRWFTALEALVRHGLAPGAGGRTPSDLPLVALSQAEIEAAGEQVSADRG
jgi:non-ribosomal peptide synthase protein (TIGR01720 family)